MRLFIALAFVFAVSPGSAQIIRMKYFHYNANPFGMLVNENLDHFISAYNTFAVKPAGVTDYRIKKGSPLTGSILPGFSYKGSRNLITTPVFFGGTQITSKGNNIPKSTAWAKNIELAYVGTGIGYLGFLFTKEEEKSYRFPKLEYQVSLNAEWNSFRYKDEGGAKQRGNYIRPSATAFIQYNFYPPSTDYKKRPLFGINLQYHTNLMPVDLRVLQQDLSYDYSGSLKNIIGDFTVGVTFAFIDNIEKRHKEDNFFMIRIEAIDAVTKRKIPGDFNVRSTSGKNKIKYRNGYYAIKKKSSLEFPQLEVTVHARGYFAAKQNITSQQPLYQIPMNRIHPEVSLATLFFNHASTTMADSSRATLNGVLETLQANPDISIVVKGHTSSEGSARMNMRLSRHRAEYVRDFLISGNINKRHIKTIGLGATDPLFPDDSEIHRAGNRRVEIFILKIK